MITCVMVRFIGLRREVKIRCEYFEVLRRARNIDLFVERFLRPSGDCFCIWKGHIEG